MSHIGKDVPELIPPLGATFFQSWEILDGQVKVIFSNSAYNAFKKLFEFTFFVHFYSKQETTDRVEHINKFKEIRNTVLRVLSKEIGIL